MCGVRGTRADPLPSCAVTPTIDALQVVDSPAAWSALGFVVEGERCRVGSVELRFAAAGQCQENATGEGGASGAADGGATAPRPVGIVGWSLREIASTDLDGLPTTRSESQPAPPAPAHPNGVRAIDHLVAISPELDRSVDALRAAGLDLRRVREEPTPAGAPRQAFFRLGAEILEVIQEPQEVIARAGGSERALRFWGLAMVVEDLDRTVEQLAPNVGEVRPAVQPGRRIATLRRSAGLAVPLALISAAEPGAPSASKPGAASRDAHDQEHVQVGAEARA